MNNLNAKKIAFIKLNTSTTVESQKIIFYSFFYI